MEEHKCKQCESKRLLHIHATCNDRCCLTLNGKQYFGYVPYYIGLGGGSSVRFWFCMDCGQIEGDFPLDETGIEKTNQEK